MDETLVAARSEELDCPGRSRDRAVPHPPAAGRAAGRAACHQYRTVHHDPADHHEYHGSAGIFNIPIAAPDNDAVPAGHERFDNPPDPVQRLCRAGYRGVWRPDYKRQYCHWLHHILHYRPGAVPCHHQGRGTRCRSCCPLYVGRDARQADGD